MLVHIQHYIQFGPQRCLLPLSFCQLEADFSEQYFSNIVFDFPTSPSLIPNTSHLLSINLVERDLSLCNNIPQKNPTGILMHYGKVFCPWYVNYRIQNNKKTTFISHTFRQRQLVSRIMGHFCVPYVERETVVHLLQLS